MRTRRLMAWLVLLLAQAGGLWAQPQFRNTTSFDTGDSLYYWSARLGARTCQRNVLDDTTTGYHVMSTCTLTPDLVGDSVIRSVYVDASVDIRADTVFLDTLGDYYIVYDTVTNLLDTCRTYGTDDARFRFRIYSQNQAGLDNFTIDTALPDAGLPRIPPGYTSSIRLGCMVGSSLAVRVDSNLNLSSRRLDTLLHLRHTISEGDPFSPEQLSFLARHFPDITDRDTLAGLFDLELDGCYHGSQSLFYTMRVTEDNALLILNYALVARRYNHTAYDAGEFLVRIVARDSSGRWADGPINDSLWFKISAPMLAVVLTDDDSWRQGATEPEWPCRYVYMPWNKCAVDLSRFIGKDVRVEFYASNCIWGVDPLYAYIAGDYASPTLSSSGCPMDQSPFVDTLVAPAGLLGYEWFVSTEGPQEDLSDYAHLETVTFRRLTNISTSNIYCPTLNDFLLPGNDTLTHQTFMCIMHSALDPAKPITSRLYANVYNHRPVPMCEVRDSCDQTLTFISHAVAPLGDSIDPQSLYWVLYDDALGQVVLDTLFGDSAVYRFPEVRSYLVEQSVAIFPPDGEASPCRAARRSFRRVKGGVSLRLRLSAHAICAGTELRAEGLFDSLSRGQWQGGGLHLEWRVDGRPLSALGSAHRVEHDTLLVLSALGEGVHTVELLAENAYGCTGVSADSVFVYDNPRILIDPPSGLLCLGDTLTLTVFRDDVHLDSAWFDWTIAPPDPTFEGQEGLPVLHLLPTETSTYTLHPSPLSLCQQGDISVLVEVLDYPVPALSCSPSVMDLDRSSVLFEDLTPGARQTLWNFGDGTTATGPRTVHQFNSPSLDGVDVRMLTCNRALCCSDTSVHLPVEALSLWVPNTFAPGQGDNGFFAVFANRELVDFEVWIYNRRGLLVYSSGDPHFRWNGTDLGGNPLPQESYVYTLRYRFASDGEHYRSATGTVTLLR